MTTIGSAISGIFSTILWMFAAYLSFQRNQGFDLGSQLLACCCSPCYIVYALAVPAPQLVPRAAWS